MNPRGLEVENSSPLLLQHFKTWKSLVSILGYSFVERLCSTGYSTLYLPHILIEFLQLICSLDDIGYDLIKEGELS
jgi:hypothetical protein